MAGGSAGGSQSFVFWQFRAQQKKVKEIRGGACGEKRMCLKRHFSFDPPVHTIERGRWTRLGKSNRRLDPDLSGREGDLP